MAKHIAVTMTKTLENGRKVEQPAMRTPPVVSPEAWEAARQQMLVKEKALTRARDALAAERRRMPSLADEAQSASPDQAAALAETSQMWEDSPSGWPQRFKGKQNIRTDGRPTAQWSRLKAGYSDDLARR